ncbi:MAG: amidohydrolase family protein [Synergistes sp.]|nr:amidohydrolase family protein [Synergistes sp.]
MPESVRGSCEFDYICDEKGSRIGVTGYANEGATVLFFNEKLPYCRPKNLEPLVAPVLDIYHKYGFTGVYEPGANRKLRKILAKLDAEGKIDMYYEASRIAVRESDTLKENIYRGKNFNMRTLKLFVDGTLALRTIALIEPYTDGSNYEPNLTEDELYEFMKDALANDCNIHVHAIGDRSQLEALRAFKRIQGIKPHLTRTIAHNRVNTYEALDLYESMKENTFYNSTPGWFVETPELRMYLGDKRADNNIFLMKQAIDRGVRCSIGEDFPASSIECLNPMLQLRYAVSRKAGDKIEDTPGVWLTFIGPEGSALTREDVLKCYTIWGAQQLTIDDKTGSLEAGKYADFVIWSDDFMDESKVPDSELERVTAKEVYFQGRKVV